MIEVGDMIEFIGKEAHESTPIFYPPVGTRRIVLHVYPLPQHSFRLEVRWKTGSTSGNDVWSVGKEQVRKV